MPGGIAEQIVRQRVPIYRERYDLEKERLSRERAGVGHDIEAPGGPLPIHKAEADRALASDAVAGFRPIQIDKIARTIAAKAFLGDLLIAWKQVPA
ncbi:MAG TPA: hypothetical protein VGP44_08125, partial [Gemmatimonadales bacterium]|nr:hypothetical protein [Gemmatimonadales bacterium]